MSITVRLWTKEELEKAQSDKWLATLIMNMSTFNEKELLTFNTMPFPKREFLCYWGHDEETVIYAPDVEMLKDFLIRQYIRLPDSVLERKTKYTTINI